ncbi:MAG: Holliday junction branch migration protein RuvA [Myxococcales bacterium]|nr:Holliday junction branch migration protein RuvA [Myxococcales bacterium]
MIGRLTGTVGDHGVDGSVILDVKGVGYEVHVPIGALGRLAEGAEITLHVHTHVREDALQLFGFDSVEGKQAFRALLGVSNVGPRLALAILGALDPHALAQAIASQDRVAFKGIPGVGKKTVERILLDLHGKLVIHGSVPVAKPIARPAPASLPTGPAAEVVMLLVNMGYKRPEAERAVEPLELEGKTLQELLREALANL